MTPRLPEKAVTVRAYLSSAGNGNDVTPLDLPPMLRAAIDDTQIPYKIVALCFGVKPPHLTEMLNGERAVTLDRLELLPEPVQSAFARRYAEASHWTVTLTDPLAEALADQQAATARVQALLAGRTLPERTDRQARMDLESPAAKKESA